MRTASKKILSLVLAVLLALGTLPQTVLAVGATPQEGAGGKIIAFEALSDSVANQTKPLGTSLEDLDLPYTLTATAEVPAGEEQGTVQDSGESAAGDSVSGNNASGSATDEQRNGTPSDAQPSDDEELLQIQSTTSSALALGNSGTQQTASVPVLEWTSEPEYDPQTTGTYVFTPVLADDYSLADTAELPTITITIEATPVFRSMLPRSDSTGVDLGLSPALVEQNANPQPEDNGSPPSSPTLDASTKVWFGGYQWVVSGWDGKGVASEQDTATLLYANDNTYKPILLL